MPIKIKNYFIKRASTAFPLSALFPIVIAMLCDNCGADSETYLILQEGLEQERKLCRDCAERLGYLGVKAEARAPGALEPASGQLSASFAHWEEDADEEKSCTRCGLTASALSREGRLGCALCVTVFRRELASLWRRSGRAQAYVGKAPGSQAGAGAVRRLHESLANAIQNEDFEQAATLRDRLRELEAGENP
jgi:protein arginine kinase activator